MSLPIVAIVGRPNVGKSTLFNRVVKKRVAIVASESGTTRDRVFCTVETKDASFLLIDTGGLDGETGEIEENIQLQSHMAIADADIILFLVDMTEEVTALDYEACEILRKTKQKDTAVILCASKVDKTLQEGEKEVLCSLGLGMPMEISAAHNKGMKELLATITQELKTRGYQKRTKGKELEAGETKIAFAGKPNAGKSSLINAFLEEDRLIVSSISGTTRDATNSFLRYDKNTFTLIDTAGVRKRGKIEKGIEKFSVMRTLANLESADVGVLVLDSIDGITAQDQHIAQMMIEAKCGMILLVNKWDVTGKEEEQMQETFLALLRQKYPFLPWAPVVFASAKTKKNIHKIFPLVLEIKKERAKRISTGKLNAFLRDVNRIQKPTGTKIVRPKILYITQAEINPPVFVVFVNRKNAFHFSYWRFLENRLREAFQFTGTPISFQIREREQ